ncbi:MAG: hypothetical protein KDC88_14730, partial [Ignavibacteriae bacterium]|nr:hypothetical protein [Ignavibacteriota bacterium]
WGLPVLPDDKPKWFDRMFLDDWITLPQGVEKRFADFKYDRIFKSFNELAKYSQMNQFSSLKYEIERIRLADEIKGYVITEFTDINWECNGLLDMWRNPKIFHDELSMIQNPDIIIPFVEKYNYWNTEAIDIQIYFSHYGYKTLSDLKLEWFVDGEKNGEHRVSRSIKHNLELVHSLKLESPKVNSPKKIRIRFKLIGMNNDSIAENYIEVFVYPQIVNKKPDIHITNSLDEFSINKLNEGGNVICFIDSASVVPNDFPFNITSRNEDWYDGNWATNLNWVADTKPFKEMGLNKIINFEIDKVIPNYIITDIPNENFDDVLSGMFVAWLYLNSGYIVQMSAGDGKLLLVTFDMYKNYDSDPFAATLLNKLSDYINSDLCKPKSQWKL